MAFAEERMQLARRMVPQFSQQAKGKCKAFREASETPRLVRSVRSANAPAQPIKR